MSRKNIYEILSEGKIDILGEYSRIYQQFYQDKFLYEHGTSYTVKELVDKKYRNLDKRLIGRTLSINDFDFSYKYHFCTPEQQREVINSYENKGNEFVIMDDLISLLEYVYNFTHYLIQTVKTDYPMLYANIRYRTEFRQLNNVIENIVSCANDLGLEGIAKDGLLIFVAKTPEALAVAEFTNENLSYKLLEYNHYRLRGELTTKLGILKLMADDIEPQRKILNGINKTLAGDLFQMLQKFVRHNNEDNPYIKSLSPKEIEDCYDDIYQMWLLAKLEIDNLERKKRVEFTLQKINDK